MKARIKATGETITVERVTKVVYKSENRRNGTEYYCESELEIPIRDMTLSEKIEDCADRNRFNCIVNNSKNGCSVYLGNNNNTVHSIVSISKGDNYAWVSDLFVKEKYRNKGIGKNAVNTCEEIAKLLSVEFVELKVLHGTFTEKWYMSMGYSIHYKDGEYDYMIKKL